MNLLDGVHFDNLESAGGEDTLGSSKSLGRASSGGSFRKSLDVAEAREGRIQRSVEIRKRQRGATAQAKRRRALEKQERAEGAAQDSYTADQVSQALHDLDVPENTARAVADLRAWLSLAPLRASCEPELAQQEHDRYTHSDVATQLCIDRGMVEKMLPLLRVDPRADDAEARFDLAFNATWCITNIATGTAEQTQATLCAVPALTTLLNRGPRKVRDQAAWALGNMAAENQSVREELIRVGVIPPLVILLREPHSPEAIRVKRTAAWALCNLARGDQTSGKPFFSAAAHLALVEILESYTDQALREGFQSDAGALISEVLWTLTFLSAKEPTLCIILVHQKILTHLVRLFTACKGELSICIPSLRALANLIPLRLESPPGREASLVTAVCQQPGFLDTLQSMMVEGESAARVREAIWTVANLFTLGLQTKSGGPLSQDETAVVHDLMCRFAAPLCVFFTKYTSEFMLPASTALLNLVNREDVSVLINVINEPTSPRVLDVFISLLQERDIDIVYRALDFVEMVLARLSNPFAAARLGGRSGVRLVMDYEGIEALEHLEMRQLPAAHSNLCARAHRLVDRFFGVDFEEAEEAEAMQLPEQGANMFKFPASSTPSTQPNSSPASAGRGAHLLRPAWLAQQQGQQQMQQMHTDSKQRTLPECGFNAKMET
ncbi:Importin subunit alpha [Hondaea fermentalgiana]|uniref:Importin subunit alpha n=1 Tax=Hondaea fermentalgiana TaxID=2315210 RepID=A0A2R5GQC5_9STRA|nr:Importin subunit alpha [Hondaea fermentalgiana]|eukprot:GBG33072.1 Importin subunit alpha [Hondaea fermentalgiana]